MTWTYSGDPSSADRDAVRFLIGDTDSADPQLTDEELAYLLTQTGSVTGAAVSAVQNLLAKYARLVDKSVGDLRISYSQRQTSYSALLTQLRRKQALGVASPIAGGISKSRVETVEEDDDLVQHDFRRKQFDYPGDVNDRVSDDLDD